MKKIKLKESDIERLVNKVLKEENTVSAADVKKDMISRAKDLQSGLDNPKEREVFMKAVEMLGNFFKQSGNQATGKVNNLLTRLFQELSKEKGEPELSKEKGEPEQQNESIINELYDDPGTMARHTGGYMGQLTSIVDTIIDNMVYLEHLLPEVMDKKLQTKLDNFLEKASDPLEDLNDELDKADDRLMRRFRGWEN